MAIVIHNGKRYKFHAPLKAGRYTVTRYSPSPDSDGIVNSDDLLIYIEAEDGGYVVELDDADARQLNDDIFSLGNGDITEEQLIARLDVCFNDIVS